MSIPATSDLATAIDPTGTNFPHSWTWFCEEITTYGDLSSICEDQDAEEPTDVKRLFIFKKILSPHGPIMPNDPPYYGSSWNLKIEWEGGSRTEPLDLIGADNPASCAKYADEHELLDTPGWKHFRHLACKEESPKNDETG